MNLNEGNSVSVRINQQLVTARIVQFISNTDILVELVGATYYGQQIISISAEDIIHVIDNGSIQNRVTNVNSVMPAAYSQSSRPLFPNITTIIPRHVPQISRSDENHSASPAITTIIPFPGSNDGPIQNRVTNVNSVMPAAYSQSSRPLFPNITTIIPRHVPQISRSDENHSASPAISTIIPFPGSNDDSNRNSSGQSFPGGKKSRRNRLKKKHSKRY